MGLETNTVHLPSMRSDVEELQNERRSIEEAPFVAILMDTIPELAMILNKHRQIVAVNRMLMQSFGVNSVEQFIGKRPGEAFGCIHFGDGPDGCGTAPNCSVCGAALSIYACQKTGGQSTGECMISLQQNGGSSMDFEATATPLRIEDKMFTVFTLKDISAEKRKQVMEKTFFHDLINTAGGIRGLAEILVSSDSLTKDDEEKYKGWMLALSDNLIDEIKHHRRLLAAERGKYEPTLEVTDLGMLLEEVCRLYENHEKSADRNICLSEAPPCTINTDQPVLRRIIGNMVLNALEAIDRGASVQIGCRQTPECVRIEVSNPGEIEVDAQLKMFKRSFSTKSTSGRGIGTYSMKLFGERYLGGVVGFVSRDSLTTFFIELPLTSAIKIKGKKETGNIPV